MRRWTVRRPREGPCRRLFDNVRHRTGTIGYGQVGCTEQDCLAVGYGVELSRSYRPTLYHAFLSQQRPMLSVGHNPARKWL